MGLTSLTLDRNFNKGSNLRSSLSLASSNHERIGIPLYLLSA